MANLEELEKRIEIIERRNKKVETDKTWETSYARKIILMIFTYLAIGLYMRAINVSDWFLNAIIPSFAFMISTLSLPSLKNFWEKHIYKK
ncbi:MAG: hypothetical protein Q8P80_05430 [Candidatus Levybacteria bacterium]|nr:hypothetical protein [Candidatus Levybacteria bacterium]